METHMNKQKNTSFVPRDHLEYPELTMFQMIARIAEKFPGYPAFEFYKKQTSYRSHQQQC